VLLATFGLFLVFSCIRRKTAPRLVTALSKGSFGMYLMHLLFLAPIAGVITGGDPASPLLPVWLAIPVIAVLTFACCAVTTSLLSRIPGSKWVIGC
jgi:surface polysaccharide O-acyltransferase-like enzyme